MKLYISGPIKGMKDSNRESFRYAQWLLEREGFGTVNPQAISHDHAGPCLGDIVERPDCPECKHRRELHAAYPDEEVEATCPPHRHRYGCYLRADIIAMFECDGIAMLPGWQKSTGARVEFNVAEACGMHTMTLISAELNDLYQEAAGLNGPAGREVVRQGAVAAQRYAPNLTVMRFGSDGG